MTGWKTAPSTKHADNGHAVVELSEFGRSSVELFPLKDGAGRWKYVIDGKTSGICNSRDEAARRAEIEAWNSQENTLFARGVRHDD